MRSKLTIAVVVGVVFISGVVIQQNACNPDDGWPPHDGKLRQTVRIDVDGLRRGGPGIVALSATANFTRKEADVVDSVPVPSFKSISLALVDSKGVAKPLQVAKWETTAGTSRGTVTLPEVPDGDYKLRASYKTKLGAGDVDVNVPLYTPARIHVITDRPLYEPGNLVRFRAVVLRARDLAPLDGRPGRWIVKDPDGEVLLEESSPAGDWGVIAGSFPLDKGAATGTWRVAWQSADAADEIPFTVEPFTLPRFRVEASASKAYYRPLETPVVRGSVVYSSGAPVAGAELGIEWDVDGDWPPPTAWLETLLPKVAKVAANGRFELKLPEIPRDLQGQVTMTARISAVDPAGDRVEGRASVLLSEDGIAVSAVTEIGDGLVQGFNNRIYIRVTTPDGVVVPKAAITVKRAWQGDDPGLVTVLDEDGVASLQIDPGAPVNVVIPPLPYRPPPMPELVTRDQPEELINQEGASLADQVEMDRWLAALRPCALWYDDDDSAVSVGIRVTTGGALTVVAAGSTALDRCVVSTLRSKRLPGGADRMYSVTFSFVDPPLPSLSASVDSALEIPEGLETAVAELAMRARDCLPRDASGSLPRALTWTAREDSKDVLFGGWIADPAAGEEAAVSAMGCAQGRLTGARISLDTEAAADAIGIVRFSVDAPVIAGEERPEATTMLGYELAITTEIDGKPATTKLRLTPGEVPDLRLRVSPVLAKAGDKIAAELIRGPGFARTGRTLPRTLQLEHLKGKLEVELDDKNKTELTIPDGAEGWIQIGGGGARALVYVKPENDLAVAVTPRAERYAPGQQAELSIETKLGGKGAKAAVGLIGVDESLGQLATLPGVEELARLRPQVETTSPAFGVLDGQALTLGRIRGVNAAAATVLRVGATPRPPDLDAVVAAQGETTFDPIAELTDNFYNVLAELHVQVRAWEQSAPASEQMKPETMVRLWNQAIDACVKRGEPVVDAWGRRLRLSRLPRDLLMLTDPHVVVAVGTRLPEDVEGWVEYVEKGEEVMRASMKLVLILAAVAACKSDGAPDDWDRSRAASVSKLEPAPEPEEEDGDDESGGTGTAMALEEGKMGKKDSDRAEGQYKMRKAQGAELARAVAVDEARNAGVLGGAGGQPAPGAPPADGEPGPGADKNRPEGLTRAWFPETFLFEPRILTDDNGVADIKVRVPDRLTTWRVLALAHSRTGAQGAAVASFLGTLPTYVDLVVPDTLVRGDEVRLPVQLVNTTEKAVTETLALQAQNAQLAGGGGSRTMPAQGALVDYARLVATTPGQITIRAGLGGSDAVVRTIEVLPVGRPETVNRTGTLAAPRSLSIEGPSGADPETGRVRLLAFPGALALLRAELAVCTARQSVADDAYALMLAGNAKGMLAALGDEADPEALRTLSIVTAQRSIRHARTLDVDTATLITEAALGHVGNPVVTRLGERAAAYLVRQQRPDGTFGGESGQSWELQRVVVATAMAVRAVAADTSTPEAKQRAVAVRIAASGAFERHMPQVQDPYTAAVVLASGAVKGTLAETLRKRVKDALVAGADGAKTLAVPAKVLRADGTPPSAVEATAMAVLALEGDPQAGPQLADLGATLLGSYDPVMGWGDGRTNLVALRAVLQLFKTPVPEGVTITLSMDGTPVLSGVLDRGKLREVLALEGAAPALAGAHTWEVKAEPAVPGLGYSLTLVGWVPWEKAHGVEGLELQLPETVQGTVGKPTDIALRAVAPQGVELHIEHSLPAGVQVDTPSLEKLVEDETISRFTVATGKVDLYIDGLDPGETFAASYRVIPTLAGKLHSSASVIEGNGVVNHVPPSVWLIK